MASNDTSQVLYEELKCFICECGPKAGKSEWYQCLSQHQICQDCKTGDAKDLNKCPCGRFISSDHSRVMEKLLDLETTRFKCKNTNGGCGKFLAKDAMISHEVDCIYRLVNCPQPKCETKVPFRELIQHMKTKHYTRKLAWWLEDVIHGPIPEHLLKDGEFCYQPCMIEYEKNLFFITSQAKNGVFYQWIHFLGSPTEAEKYAYTLEYKDVTNSVRNMTYTGKVVSVDESRKTIQENYNCFSVAYGFFKAHFIDTDRKFKYSLKIRNLKEEAKDDNVESGISDDE